MQITIPTKNGDLPYERIEMESFLRDNLLTKNHMFIRMLALQEYNLNKDYYISVPIVVLLHWLLDRMIDETAKGSTIKVVGEKMGLAPARSAESYKIKGFLPKEDNSQFMLDFTRQLAAFITRRLALKPADNEGIKIEELERYIDPQPDMYIAPPIPPGVAPIDGFNPRPTLVADQPLIKPMPPAPTRKPRGRPAKAAQTAPVESSNSPTELSLELLSRSIRGEINSFEEKFMRLEDIMNALESRLIILENKVK